MGRPVYAITNAFVDPAVQVRRGEVWDDEDPIVRQHPQHFTDDPYAHGLMRHSTAAPPVRAESTTESGGAVETTTAAPGEKRIRTTSSRG